MPALFPRPTLRVRPARARAPAVAWMLGLATAFLAAGACAAQPDPSDPRAPARPLIHRASLQERATQALPTAPAAAQGLDWPALNRRTQAAGGWKAYAREAQAPEPRR